jgi:NAD(P)-dependent dehydrogenase (short-subunit alcohol dehydrogenase family)
MQRILITGSNRGIGLDLTRRYLERGEQVFATCRNPDSAVELKQLAAQHSRRLQLITLDVTDEAAITEAARLVSMYTDGLDMLINNAGILPGGVGAREPNIGTLGQLEAAAMLRVFEVNAVAPIIVAQAFADLLRNGTNPRLINVSSDAGSITNRNRGCDYSYPASKAALNMMTRCLSGDLRGDGVIVVSMHPGFIKTDMGGPNARLTLDEAIPDMMRVIDDLTLENSGQFINWDGKQIPW